jgi:hypothetical protein
MTRTGAGIDPVDAIASRCGCAGKTPLDRVVRPALNELREQLETVRIAGDLEAGLLPNTSVLERSIVGSGTAVEPRATPNIEEHPPRFVTTAFVDAESGSDPDRFCDGLVDAYQSLVPPHPNSEAACSKTDQNESGTVIKGHSIQLEGATEPVIWGEQFVPSGRRRPGYRAVNIDVVHAFPQLEPDQQATVAIYHALNDCYAQGATDERIVRPIVAVPEGSELLHDRVRRWYRMAAPADVAVYEPAIITHSGRGWQFGASTTAATNRTPPVRRLAIKPGDEILLHRPLGGLALYAGSVAGHSSLDSGARERATEALTTDHVAVARAIAGSCPAPDESFDPDQHLKWVGDISGSGIQGLVHVLGTADCGLRLTNLPLLDRDSLARIRKQWIVPDVTVETNGPLAAIGKSSAVDRFKRRLKQVPATKPTRIGRAIGDGGALWWDTDIALERYVEGLPRQQLS